MSDSSIIEEFEPEPGVVRMIQASTYEGSTETSQIGFRV